ncbi:hypothetical protein HMPREF0731_2721, partial [Pseudoroseomonas cervicalis ATCC 49957]
AACCGMPCGAVPPSGPVPSGGSRSGPPLTRALPSPPRPAATSKTEWPGGAASNPPRIAERQRPGAALPPRRSCFRTNPASLG